MRWSARLEQAQQVACCLLAITLPLLFIWSTISIWILIIFWLLAGRYLATWRHFKGQPAFWLWTVYFGLHAASYFWSDDKEQSIFDSVSKLSFVILPIVVGAGANICRRRMEQILACFALGVAGVAIFCVVQATGLWRQDGSYAHFFYHELVRGLDANAVYMAWYTSCALSALLLIDWRFQFRRSWGLARWALTAILLLFLILLSSRLLLAVFVLLTVPAYLLKLVRSKRSTWGIILAVLIVTGSLAGTVALTGNPVNSRYRDVMNRDVQVAFLPEYRDTIPHFNNLTLRLFLWRCGLDNVRKHQLWLKGTGNGDEHHVQNARFEELGITADRQARYNIAINNMNLHNMYLQSLVTLGIPGLLVFIALILLPFFFLRNAPERRFFFVFHTVAVLFMIQESALQTQAGVIFFAFFHCIYWQAVKRASLGEKSPLVKR